MRKQELHPRTEIINKKQKNQSKKLKEEALQWLASRFPKAFDNSLQINPLKNGIMEDVLLHAEEAASAGISKSKLREAVVIFTRRIDYLTALKAREIRIDLEGNQVTQVTEPEAERAILKIKKRIEKNAKVARQSTMTKSLSSLIPKNNATYNSSDETFPYYSDRVGSWSNSQAPKATAVIVKNKSRQFDPEAVARLKEKLGLSRGIEKEISK